MFSCHNRFIWHFCSEVCWSKSRFCWTIYSENIRYDKLQTSKVCIYHCYTFLQGILLWGFQLEETLYLCTKRAKIEPIWILADPVAESLYVGVEWLIRKYLPSLYILHILLLVIKGVWVTYSMQSLFEIFTNFVYLKTSSALFLDFPSLHAEDVTRS